MSRKLLLVAGSGRSGTSLFSSIVGNLGLHVPEPWVPTDDSNPRGFGEPQWVVDNHTALLKRANVHASDARPNAWSDTAKLCLDEQVNAGFRRWLQSQFSDHDHILIKDPRLLWFLPLWHQVGEDLQAEVRVVTMLRHPAEVVGSKLRWYSNMSLSDANRVAGWINTMLFTERATREHQRAFVRFDDLLEDWTQPIARVSKQFDIPELVNARAVAQASADSLVDRSLRRSAATWEDFDISDGLAEFAERIWEDLLLAANPDPTELDDTLARLDRHREEYASFYRHAEHVAQSTTLAVSRTLSRNGSQQPLENVLLSGAQKLIPSELRDRIPLNVKLTLFGYAQKARSWLR